ncbi:MAG: hypothetical protein IKT31_02650 [Firmicutes bacterium]|nr:hypothetical protein [Bacillota bacterium]
MKKEFNEYLAELKKVLTPKILIFIGIGIAAFIIHPLLGLIFAGVVINFLMSFYTSKGVLNHDSSAEEVNQEANP